jgi:hypothetical protein
MIRRALIIYCDDTESGELLGPSKDNSNLRNYLTSLIGGEWEPSEIKSLRNPTIDQVKSAVNNFLNTADYTFTVFSGHGWINTNENNTQYLEVGDGDISIYDLETKADRQTIIIDSCRGYISPLNESLSKGLGRAVESFSSRSSSTRQLFDNIVMRAEEGISVLFSASENQSSSDSEKGGAYIYSLLAVSRNWFKNDKTSNIFTVKNAHQSGILFMKDNFNTKQKPVMIPEKRMRYFPLSVKFTPVKL